MSELDEDIFDQGRSHRGHTRRQRRARDTRTDRRRGAGCVAMVLAAAVVVAAMFFAFGSLRSLIPGAGESTDYEGTGHGSVEVEITSGMAGSQIGETLVEAGVVKSTSSFTSVAQSQPDKASAIQPGTYSMRKEMSASSAFDRLLDPKARVARGITLSEGLWRSEIYTKLSEGTGVPVADYEKAEKSSDLKLPDEAEGDLEGWLFPSTYEFEKGTSAVQQLNQMITMTTDQLTEAGVARKDWERTLTVASIVEGESGAADRGKVARVIENRLEDVDGPTVGMLNMDSTVHYVFQERGKAGTTDEMRASDSPYNTYKHTGLPPGPINNPGAEAIKAAGDPDEGDWLFFVTVNPDTGETKFAETQREHDNNVKEFQQWCSDNQDRC
ncbi:endolytic transglycosylase MltG [Janibacter hoylei]|uniref:Endolytic murein transglycosylase n=1 Tax=Janibacter hoylei PVAS-1 TaxID=1210046 RepID=K1DVR8_9MICO|nr:endolytic transglycosylase MltG [Janibacter hoylei]EKA60620.1 periplasmic solute-binding protein [Janibacter hoylei PVAS-1]RWU81505.1 endolytic transglycosylase MltG [Janibacter hoylei PVAS-1]